jgi:hypothetical protein
MRVFGAFFSLSEGEGMDWGMLELTTGSSVWVLESWRCLLVCADR